jgi:hypothetical protein
MSHKRAEDFKKMADDVLSQKCPPELLEDVMRGIEKNASQGYYRYMFAIPDSQRGYLRDIEKTFKTLGFVVSHVKTENIYMTLCWSFDRVDGF